MIPSAKYETEQDKQGQYHHFQLPLSELYLPLQCLAVGEPGGRDQNCYMINLPGNHCSCYSLPKKKSSSKQQEDRNQDLLETHLFNKGSNWEKKKKNKELTETEENEPAWRNGVRVQ